MAHAIGCIGSSVDQRSKPKAMTKEIRARNMKLVPRKMRNQARAISFIEIAHEDGCRPKVRAIKNGQLGHYESAFYFGKVRYLTNPDGTRIVIRNPKAK